MMIDPKFLIYHDLIGLNAFAKPISKLSNKKFLPIGVIINETRDILIAENIHKVKKFIKKDFIFRFEISDLFNEEGKFYLEVQGDKIVGLPINRLRSLKKKKWFKR